MPTAVALRPRSFSELFDAAFLLAREHVRPLATLSAMIAIPAVAANVVAVAVFGPMATPTTATPVAIAGVLPVSLLVMCWYFVGIAALVQTASDAYLGNVVDPAASLRRALRRAGTIIGAHLLAYLTAFAAIMAALVALVIAGTVLTIALSSIGMRASPNGIPAAAAGVVAVLGTLALVAFVFARYANTTAVVMLEGGGAVAALRRSSALGAGHLGRIVGLFVILAVLAVTFTVTALGLGSVVQNAYVPNLLSTLLSVPLYVMMACVLTALYYDLRIRKEGFDIAFAARELGEAPQPVPAA